MSAAELTPGTAELAPGTAELALCGGCVDGKTPFSAALRTAAGTSTAASPDGSRGDLAAMTQGLLAAQGLTAQALRRVAVDRGPGSYIGLRVAVTFARTLCAFSDAELFALDSLALAAAAGQRILPQRPTGRIAVAVDGRQGRVQIGIYEARQGEPLRTTAHPALLPDDRAAALLQPTDGLFVDPACAARLAPLAAALGAQAHPLPAFRADVAFSPMVVWHACSPLQLEPLYLTGSYIDGSA